MQCWVSGDEALVCRVVAKERLVIPPWSYRWIPIDIPFAGSLAAQGIVSPAPRVIENRELLMLPGVVDTRASDQWVKVVNFGEESCELQPKMFLGTCESYFEIGKDTRVEHVRGIEMVESPASEEIPEHLQDLYERSTQHLEDDQHQEVKKPAIEMAACLCKVET